MMEMLITFLASYYIGGYLAAYGNWPDAPSMVAVIVMGWFILRQLKKNQNNEK